MTVPFLMGVSIMLSYQDRVPDKTIERKVTQRMARAGLGSQSKVKVVVRNGQVTMSGTLQYEVQRRNVLNSARGVAGVRNVVDQLQYTPKKKNWC
jgi:osmotically-inducible protein OsmY